MFRSNAFFLFRIILLHSLSVFAYTILSFLRPVLLHSLPALRFAAIFLRTSVSSHFGSSVRFIFLKGTCKVTAFSSDSLSSAHISFVFCPAMTLDQFLWMALRIPSASAFWKFGRIFALVDRSTSIILELTCPWDGNIGRIHTFNRTAT